MSWARYTAAGANDKNNTHELVHEMLRSHMTRSLPDLKDWLNVKDKWLEFIEEMFVSSTFHSLDGHNSLTSD